MSVDTEQVEQAARQLIDGRIEAVRTLATARQTTEQARHALAEAQRADAQAWADAERAGWTSAELRRVGFTPSRKAPGRPRSTRSRPPQASETTPTE